MSVPSLLRSNALTGPASLLADNAAPTGREAITVRSIRPQLRVVEVLLSRLEVQVLGTGGGVSGSDAELGRNAYARRKMESNIEHARTQLLQLEHQLPFVTPHTQRAALAANLNEKRALVKRMNRRLVELDQLDVESDEDERETRSTRGGDGRGTVGPGNDYRDSGREGIPHLGERTDYKSGLDAEHDRCAAGQEARPPQEIARLHQQHQPPLLPSGLRARTTTAPTSEPNSATAQTSALFSARASSTTQPVPTAESRQALLLAQESEQSRLAGSLVSLASALRESNLSFAASLETEKSVLDRAAGGLDRNALGMESAGRRMGALRRMTEGQGWYGRLKLYALIAGLWLVLFLLVFVGPKLRF